MSTTILPCPHCRGTGETDNSDQDGSWWVACSECGARSGSCRSEGQAIEEWNRRNYTDFINQLITEVNGDGVGLHRWGVFDWMDLDVRHILEWLRSHPSRKPLSPSLPSSKMNPRSGQ